MSIIRDWQAWIDEKFGPKLDTFGTRLLECAKEEADKLQKEYEWECHDVAVTAQSVHLSFVVSGNLYYVMVPVKLAARTLNISKHLRTGVQESLKHLKEVFPTPQDSQQKDCEE